MEPTKVEEALPGSSSSEFKEEPSGPSTFKQDSSEEVTKIEPETSAGADGPGKETKEEVRYFQCSACDLNERYEYFGNDPPFVQRYRLLEDAYLIEDPFVPPKQGEFIVVGAHCVKCGAGVCKDTNCSFYYGGTYCIGCAKSCSETFPGSVQEKLNRIVVP